MIAVDLTARSHDVPAVVLDRFTPIERRQLQRLCRVAAEGSTVRLTRIPHRAGHLEIKGLRVVARPPLPHRTLLLLVMYANGLSLDRLDGDVVGSAEAETEDDEADVLVAHAMAVAARQLLRQTVAQQYVPAASVLTALRGRPQWHRVPAQPPGIECRYYEKRTDNELNRTVLAGLGAADRILQRRGAATSLRSDLHVWRELAMPVTPTRSDVDAQVRGLNHLTTAYRSSLVLARCLLFGCFPEDFLDPTGEVPFPGLVLDLGLLFENLLSRVVGEVAGRYGITVESQRVRSDAIVDGAGATYKRVRPDLVVRRRERATLILDAKFKPRYLACRPGTRRPVTKVSNEDLYQLFFYQSHLQDKSGRPVAAIIAPQIRQELPKRSLLHFNVASPSGSTLGAVRLVPLPLAELLEQLRASGRAADAVPNAAPALDLLLRSAAQ